MLPEASDDLVADTDPLILLQRPDSITHDSILDPIPTSNYVTGAGAGNANRLAREE